MAKLLITLDGVQVGEREIDKERLSIGRRPHNDIVLDNIGVSGEHATLVTILNDSFLEDLGSTNGTVVNGAVVRKHFLHNGDLIEIGRHKLRFVGQVAAVREAADFEKTMVLNRPAPAPRGTATGEVRTATVGSYAYAEALPAARSEALAAAPAMAVSALAAAPAVAAVDEEERSRLAAVDALTAAIAQGLPALSAHKAGGMAAEAATPEAPVAHAATGVEVPAVTLAEASPANAAEASAVSVAEASAVSLGEASAVSVAEAAAATSAEAPAAPVAEAPGAPTEPSRAVPSGALPEEGVAAPDGAPLAEASRRKDRAADVATAIPELPLSSRDEESGADVLAAAAVAVAGSSRSSEAPARLQVLNGTAAGRILEINKPLTTIGRPGVQVAVISRRSDGYYLAQVDGDAPARLNGTPLVPHAVGLHAHDILEIAGIKLEFFFQA